MADSEGAEKGQSIGTDKLQYRLWAPRSAGPRGTAYTHTAF